MLLPLGAGQTTTTTADDDGPGRSENSGKGSDRGRDGDDNDTDDADDDADDDDGRGHNGSEKRRGDGESRPREPGRIAQENGTFVGRYVWFRFDSSTCTILDFRLYNVTFFDSIVLNGPCESSSEGSRRHGAAVRLRSQGAELEIHDAPNGNFRFKARDGSEILFDWSDALTTNWDGKGLELRANANLTGKLRVDERANATLSPTSTNATVSDSSGSFLAQPLQGGSPERVEIREAIQRGKVAGEIDVLISNGTLTMETLSYEDVMMKVSRKNASSVRVVLDANLTGGRTFIMTLGPGVFENAGIGVRYYDQDEDALFREVPITKADDLQDVLDMAEGEGPEYWIVHDDAGKHVLVGVPSFSVHVFEVQSLPITVVPSVVAGVLLGVGLVAAAAVGMVPRRRRD